MSRDLGPPDWDRGGGPTPEAANHHQQRQSLTRNQHPQHNRPHRQCGLYASGWRDGFKAGAVDALRRAGRWLPGDPDTWPDIWAALDALADAYELAGDDVAYGLIAEQRVSRRLVGGDD